MFDKKSWSKIYTKKKWQIIKSNPDLLNKKHQQDKKHRDTRDTKSTEKAKQQMRDWYKIKKLDPEWVKSEKERKRISALIRYNTKQYVRDRQKQYNKDNPHVKKESLKRCIVRNSKLLNITTIGYKRKLKAWAYGVKTRDNNKCTHCGKSEDLHAHHILPKSLFPEYTFDIDNGITICKDFHKEVHILLGVMF